MKLLISAIVFLYSSNAAKILGIIPSPSYSHQIPYWAIFRELSLRGHQVTVITTNPQNNPALTNLTEIDLSSAYDIPNKINFHKMASQTFIGIVQMRLYILNELMEYLLTHPEILKLIHDKNESFDLAMIEIFNPVGYAFAHHFNCPFIGMSSADAYNRNYKITGNPSHPVLYPDVVSPISTLSFWNRLEMIAIEWMEEITYDYILLPEQQRMVEKQFGRVFPSLVDIEKNMSLLYVNTDLVLQTRRPLLPNVVTIGGGLHISPPTALPQKLQNFLDRATKGVIYFSLGSNVKSKSLPEETKTIILKTFSQLPYQVLWKFEVEGLLDTPKNVMISKWLPQQGVLKHPNIVLFITQGGLQSTEEAIHSFVPMLVIPFFGDQPRNAKTVVDKGMGLSLNFNSLTRRSFKEAILEIIKNPKYRKQVEKISNLIRDEPMTGLDRAIWWVEYVIRHKGAPHLKAKEIPIYQYFLLDVIGFCLAVVGAIATLLIITIKHVLQIFRKIIIRPKIKTQ